jgi:hypothetical protein
VDGVDVALGFDFDFDFEDGLVFEEEEEGRG